MDQIFIVNQNNEKIAVKVVRYFKTKTGNYFIYTLDESDEGGYVKLYATKVDIINGLLTGGNVVDDNEWNDIKNLIKVIIKENQTGNVVSVDTLPSANLINLKVDDARVFKLSKNLVELLAVKRLNESMETPVATAIPDEPIPVEPTITASPEQVVSPVQLEPVAIEQPDTMVEPVEQPVVAADYEALYREAKEENDKLRSVIGQYKERIEQIRALVG